MKSRSSSPLAIGEGIDKVDPAPSTVAHGHGHPRPRTTSVVDCRVGSAGLAGHPFYTRLNALLDADGFDTFVEDACRSFYAPVLGRPSLGPGRYFRLLLVGYFEGIDSERGIAWRAAQRRFRSICAGRCRLGSPASRSRHGDCFCQAAWWLLSPDSFLLLSAGPHRPARPR